MSSSMVLFVLAVLAPLSWAVLVCDLKYCERHPCTTAGAPTSPAACASRAGTEYRARHAGKCACCPACVTMLTENDRCLSYSAELGETPDAACRPPLLCVAGKCQEVALRKPSK